MVYLSQGTKSINFKEEKVYNLFLQTFRNKTFKQKHFKALFFNYATSGLGCSKHWLTLTTG